MFTKKQKTCVLAHGCTRRLISLLCIDYVAWVRSYYLSIKTGKKVKIASLALLRQNPTTSICKVHHELYFIHFGFCTDYKNDIKSSNTFAQLFLKNDVATFQFLRALLNATLWLSADQQQNGRASYTPANSPEAHRHGKEPFSSFISLNPGLPLSALTLYSLGNRALVRRFFLRFWCICQLLFIQEYQLHETDLKGTHNAQCKNQALINHTRI